MLTLALVHTSPPQAITSTLRVTNSFSPFALRACAITEVTMHPAKIQGFNFESVFNALLHTR